MNTTTQEPDSMLKRTVQRNLLKWAAGHLIFCPACGDVMDCKRTVAAEWQYRKPGQDWKVPEVRGASITSCAKCFDKNKPKLDAVLDKLKTRQHEEWRLDVVDGREVFGRRKN